MKKVVPMAVGFEIIAPRPGEFYNEVVDRGARRQAAGEPCFRLDIGGFPDGMGPDSYYGARADALMARQSSYGSSQGHGAYLDAVCNMMGEDFGCELASNNVVATSGGTQGLYLTFRRLADEAVSEEKSFRVAFPRPIYPKYMGYRQDLGAVAVKNRHYYYQQGADGRFFLDKDALNGVFASGITHFVFTDPNNPTGAVTSAEDIAYIKALAKQYGVVLIVDAAYEYIRFHGDSDVDRRACSIVDAEMIEAGKMIYIGTFSKTAQIPGDRLGYTLASKEVVADMKFRIGQSCTGLPTSLQLAAVKMIEKRAEEWPAKRADLAEKMEKFTKALNEIPGLSVTQPSGSIYLWPDVSNIMQVKGIRNIREFSQRLFDETGINTVPGHLYEEGCFGDSDTVFMQTAATHLRLSVGGENLERLIEVASIFKEWCSRG